MLNVECGGIKIEEQDVNLVIDLSLGVVTIELEGNGDYQTKKEKAFKEQFSPKEITWTLLAEEIKRD